MIPCYCVSVGKCVIALSGEGGTGSGAAVFMFTIWRADWYASFQRRGRFIHRKAEAGADEPLNRSQEVEQFYTSWTWRKCRKAFIEFKGHLCERCLARGIINPGSKEQPLEVHHKIPLTADNVKNPKVALSWDNLECLCKACHDEEREEKPKRWSVTADGKVSMRPPMSAAKTGAGAGDRKSVV